VSSPAHSAAWHVGPAFGDLASWADSRCARAIGSEQQLMELECEIKKMGCSSSTPKVQCGRFTASSRPFSFRPWQPSSPFFSPQVVVTQPPTNHLAVTTGGLSHPPSYQM